MPTPADEPVLVHIDVRPQGRVAFVTLNDPRRLNCLSSALAEDFVRKVRALASDKDLRAMVLTGAGDRSFIAGANIHEMKDLAPDQAEAFITLIHGMSEACQALPVPVIARINGYCFGAGPELVAACDLRVACEEATFAMPEVLVGLPSVIEAALLPRLIGWGRAQQFIYTGQPVSAREAESWGLVNRVVPMKDLDAAVEAMLAPILASGPHAIRIQKDLFHAWARMSAADGVAEGIRAFRRAFETGEPNRMLARHAQRLKDDKAAKRR
jgi:enoyl-CoA hydratase/carnithine racemase